MGIHELSNLRAILFSFEFRIHRLGGRLFKGPNQFTHDAKRQREFFRDYFFPIFKKYIILFYPFIKREIGIPFFVISIQDSNLMSSLHQCICQIAGDLLYAASHIHIIGTEMSNDNPQNILL